MMMRRNRGFEGQPRESHPLYRVWQAMRTRCSNPNATNWPRYGGRGIAVCAGWRDVKEGFQRFVADMGPRPVGGTIDRENNDAGYDCGRCDDCVSRGAPANCRWVSQVEQGNNRRNNVRPLPGGPTVAELARAHGLPHGVLYHRLKDGWPVERALSTPVKKMPPRRAS